jgi:hypothetical protein
MDRSLKAASQVSSEAKSDCSGPARAQMADNPIVTGRLKMDNVAVELPRKLLIIFFLVFVCWLLVKHHINRK